MESKLAIVCAGAPIEMVPTPMDGYLYNTLEAVTPGGKSTIKTILEESGTKKRSLQDCSGFQNLSVEITNQNVPLATANKNLFEMYTKLTPKLVFEVAAEMEPATIFALDCPILADTHPDYQQLEFDKKFGLNVRWAQESCELRQKLCRDARLLLPVQAFNIEQFLRFHQQLEGCEYDGLSIPVRHLSLFKAAVFLLVFKAIGVRRVHILGTTSLPFMMLAAYMAKNYFDFVSLDSTSWRLIAQHQMYLNHYNLKPEYLGKNVPIAKYQKNDCPCPWCQRTPFSEIKNMPYESKVPYLARHNYWATRQMGHDLFEHADSVFTLEKHLRNRLPITNSIIEAFDVLNVINYVSDADMADNIDVLSKLFNLTFDATYMLPPKESEPLVFDWILKNSHNLERWLKIFADTPESS